MKALTIVAAMSLSSPAMADGWFSAGIGGTYIDATTTGRSGNRVRTSLYTAITGGDAFLARIRASGFGYNGNSAIETAGLIGMRVGQERDSALFVGYSRLDDISETEDNTNGLSVEWIYAPLNRGKFSFEFSTYGNFNGDHDFGGIQIGMRFGSMGKQE